MWQDGRPGTSSSYRNYPRIVGETGGKDFIVAHPSADLEAVATAIVRGSFEYQGQKCSAASRVYAPSNLWPELRERLAAEVATIKMGDVADFSNFMGAVIDASLVRDAARRRSRRRASTRETEIVVGGGTDDSKGFFVEPTVIETRDPDFRLLRDELFGPVVTTYVYDETRWGDTLDLIDSTAPYGLTGAVFAEDRAAVQEAADRLRYAAGNFYVNDKPTGAVVGQQPFGGSRASGTNDKAGSIWNLIRWVTPRTIKETFVPPQRLPLPVPRRVAAVSRSPARARFSPDSEVAVKETAMFVRHATLETPELGELTLVAADSALVGVYFRATGTCRIRLELGERVDLATDAVLFEAAVELGQFLQGERSTSICPPRCTAARSRSASGRCCASFRSARRRPTATWPRASATGTSRERSVRQSAEPALDRRRLHRVVGKGGELRGYAGGLDRKRFLLDLEAGRLRVSDCCLSQAWRAGSATTSSAYSGWRRTNASTNGQTGTT